MCRHDMLPTATYKGLKVVGMRDMWRGPHQWHGQTQRLTKLASGSTPPSQSIGEKYNSKARQRVSRPWPQALQASATCEALAACR